MRLVDKTVCGLLGALYDLAAVHPFPRVVRVETTNRCNARCVICPHSRMTRRIGVMEEGLYRSIIDECARSGCRTVHLHNFGEPLLDTDLPERIAYAKAKGIKRVKIFTNASLLSPERALKLLESGLDEIKISIDGADKEEFESLRAGLRFDEVTANVRDFVRLRNERKAPAPKVIVTCCSTSDKARTKHPLEGVVDDYEFVRIHNWGETDAPGRSKVRKPCYRVWGTFTVLWNGDVAPCCLDYDGEVVLGNVAAEGSVSAIWKSAPCERIRRLHRSADQANISICRTCSKSFI